MLLIPLAGAVATLILRGLMNRPEPMDTTPISEEELHREKPAFFIAELSLEYIEPFLESIEDLLDHGFSENQRSALAHWIAQLPPSGIIDAVYPVQFDGVPADLLMHFLQIDSDIIRFRVQSSPDIMEKIAPFLGKFPQRFTQSGS